MSNRASLASCRYDALQGEMESQRQAVRAAGRLPSIGPVEAAAMQLPAAKGGPKLDPEVRQRIKRLHARVASGAAATLRAAKERGRLSKQQYAERCEGGVRWVKYAGCSAVQCAALRGKRCNAGSSTLGAVRSVQRYIGASVQAAVPLRYAERGVAQRGAHGVGCRTPGGTVEGTAL